MTRYLLFIGLLTPQLWAQPVVRNFATTNEPSALTNIITTLAPTFAQTNISYTAVTNAPWITNAPAQTNISYTAVTNAPWLTNVVTGGAISNNYGHGTNTALYNTTNTGLALVGDSGSGTMNLGKIGTYGITPYFNHILHQSTASGGHIFQSADGYPQFTVGFNNYGSVENVPRTYWQQSMQPDGASVNAMFPAAGGSASALQDLPTRGNEIWQNQRLPALVITSRGNGSEGNNLVNCTESNMKASVARFTTNGLAQIFTNNGVRLVYSVENGWLTNHRAANGLLQWNTNRWPMQAASLTNAAWFLRTNQFEPWLMLYADSVVAPTNNTEVSIDPVVGSSSPYWFYPANSTPFAGGTESQPVMTPRDILLDLSSFYAWGFRGLTVQDNKNLEKAGSQEQLRRMLAYASLYPVQISDRALGIQSQRTYRDWYPAHEHGLVLNHLFGEHTTSGATPFPPSAEFDANGLALETGGDSPAFTSAVLSYVMGALRPHLPALTNFLAKSVFYIPQSDTITMSTTWTAADWQHYFELCAMFQCNAWLTSPHYYFTNSAFQSAATNAQMLAIWQDAARERVSYAAFSANTNTAVFGRRLSDGGAAVWLVNESANASNLTVNLIALGYPPTTVAVTNVWGGFLSNASSLTVSVAATNAVFLRLGPAALNLTNANLSGVSLFGTVTNSAVMTNNVLTFQAGSANTLVLSNSNVSVGAATPMNARLAVQGSNVVLSASTDYGVLHVATTNAQNIAIGGSITLGGYSDDAASSMRSFAAIEGRKSANASGSSGGYLAFKVVNSGVLAEHFRITPTGEAQFGSSAGISASKLLVHSTSYATLFQLSGAAATNLFTVASNGNVTVLGGLTTTNGGITNLSSQPIVSGGVRFGITNVSADYAVTVGNHTANVTAGNVTLTLPTAVGLAGQLHHLKNSGTGTVTINTTSGQTIDGNASGTITLQQFDNLTVQSDGTNWIIL